MKIVKNLKHKITAGIHDYTEYLMQTTPEQRKVARKQHRAQRRAKHLKSLREFKPFNWGILRKWQERSQRRADHSEPAAAH